MHIVYILYSEKLNRFYTGFTSNFDVNYQFHQTAADPKKITAKANDWEIFIKFN
jgi:putative endonuclease